MLKSKFGELVEEDTEQEDDGDTWAILQAVDHRLKPITFKKEKLKLYLKNHTVQEALEINRNGSEATIRVFDEINVYVDGCEVKNEKTLTTDCSIRIGNTLSYNFLFLSSSISNYSDNHKPQKKLGEGAFASVFSIYSLEAERVTAIKILKMNRLSSGRYKHALSLFQNEYLIQNDLMNINITKIFNFSQINATYYIESELCPGGSLMERKLKQGEMKESSLKVIFYQVFSALAYLHEKNIIHRDVKPDNILLMTNEDVCCVKLGDFGLACRNQQSVDSKFGTFYYCAPEILSGFFSEKCEKYKNSVDIWSCTVSLFHILSDDFPFGRKEDIWDYNYYKNAKIGNIDFSGEVWKRRSNEVMKLISKVFRKPSDKRPRCRKIMNSDWFKNDYNFINDLEKLGMKVKLESTSSNKCFFCI